MQLVGEPRALSRPDRPSETNGAGDDLPGGSLSVVPPQTAAGWIDPSEIERVRAEAKREGFEDGKAQGFEIGLTEGRQSAEKAVAFRMQKAQQTLDLLVERLDQLVTALPEQFRQQLALRLRAGEADMVVLAHAAACRLLGVRLLEPAAISELVGMAIDQYVGSNTRAPLSELLAIHVHPQDLDLLQSDPALSELLSRYRSGPVPWRADESVHLGGCIVHAGDGSLDARLETQLAALHTTLLTGRMKRSASPPNETAGEV
jgi:flagellar assembly protein FliH